MTGDPVGSRTSEPKTPKLLVIVKCTVIKQVVVEGCDEHEAETDPFEFAVDSAEIDQVDWEVVDIREAPDGML